MILARPLYLRSEGGEIVHTDKTNSYRNFENIKALDTDSNSTADLTTLNFSTVEKENSYQIGSFQLF